MLREAERPSAVDAQRLERRAAAREPLVVAATSGAAGSTSPRPETPPRRPGPSRSPAGHPRAAAPTCSPGDGAADERRADRGEQRLRLRQRLVHLARRIGVPDDAAADPQVDAPSATANVRIVSASSRSPVPWTRPSAPIEAPRPTGSSAAIRSTAAIFGAPVTEPPGKTAVEHLRQADAGPELALDGRDEVLDACERAATHQLRPAHRAVARRRARGRCARGRRSSRARPRPSARRAARRAGQRPRPLDRPCPTSRRPRRERKSSGEAETIAQPSPSSTRQALSASGASLGCVSGASRAASARGEPANGAERCCTRLTW